MLLGSHVMKAHPRIFFTLGDTTLIHWLRTYGTSNIEITWWFFVLIILLTLLAITTLACGIQRVFLIARKHLAPTIQNLATVLFHFGFVVLISGQLINHCNAVTYNGNIVKPGTPIFIPQLGITVALDNLKIAFFEENSPFLGVAGLAQGISGILIIKEAGKIIKKRISANQPIRWKQWLLFIRDFYPKRKDNPLPPFIELAIKRERGISFIIAGTLLLCIGLFGYNLRLYSMLKKKGYVKGV